MFLDPSDDATAQGLDDTWPATLLLRSINSVAMSDSAAISIAARLASSGILLVGMWQRVWCIRTGGFCGL
jgi:hypothetical protein